MTRLELEADLSLVMHLPDGRPHNEVVLVRVNVLWLDFIDEQFQPRLHVGAARFFAACCHRCLRSITNRDVRLYTRRPGGVLIGLGVIALTLTEQRPTAHAEHNYTRWAWIALAATPLVFVAGIVIAFAASGSSASGGANTLGGALLGLLLLAAPTAALILAVVAARAKEPAARTVLIVGALLYGACAVLLPLTVTSASAWLIALTLSVLVLAVAGWRLARQPAAPR